MTLPDTAPKPVSRTPAEIWSVARADYLSGESAPVVAERHGLSLRSLRRRASLEGWRRTDLEVPSPATRPRGSEGCQRRTSSNSTLSSARSRRCMPRRRSSSSSILRPGSFASSPSAGLQNWPRPIHPGKPWRGCVWFRCWSGPARESTGKAPFLIRSTSCAPPSCAASTKRSPRLKIPGIGRNPVELARSGAVAPFFRKAADGAKPPGFCTGPADSIPSPSP